MKRFLTVLFVLSSVIGRSQAKISIRPTYFIAPNDTVNYGDSVQLTVYVKNTGNTVYSGVITIQAKRDTTFGGSCGSSSLSPVGLPPNDSVQTTLSFSPNFAGNFKVGGNGNTIVVWPYIAPGTGDIGDSLRLVLWISDFNSVKETNRKSVEIYPNPVSAFITIKSLTPPDHQSVIIYDVFARKIRELTFSENIDLSELTPGSYWMLIKSADEIIRIPFIKD